jgi:hypothetical protein
MNLDNLSSYLLDNTLASSPALPASAVLAWILRGWLREAGNWKLQRGAGLKSRSEGFKSLTPLRFLDIVKRFARTSLSVCLGGEGSCVGGSGQGRSAGYRGQVKFEPARHVPGQLSSCGGQGQSETARCKQTGLRGFGGAAKSQISLRRSRVLHQGGLCEPEPRNGVGFPPRASGWKRATTVPVFV